MSDDIDLNIRSRFQSQGAEAAIKALERLAKAQQQADKAQVAAAGAAAKLAQADARLAQSAANTAAAQNRSALAAQKLATEQARTTRETAQAAAAQLRNEASALRMATAHTRATASVKRTGDGLAILPRAFAGLTSEVQSQIGALAGWGAALGAGVAVVRSFGDAFTLAANLDATTRSIEAQLGATRDFGAVQQQATAFGREFGFTQQETTAALAASVPILQSSAASADEILATLARLAVLNPAEGIEGAAFALRELTSGDVISLVERFNLSKTEAYKMRDAIAAGGDAVQIMGEYLDGAGVGMDTLRTRTEGAMGAMNELKQAQEELALAQAEWAQGPGLEILQVQIDALRGSTRLLTGDFDTAGQSLAANIAYYTTFAQVLAETGDVTMAVAAATRAKGEALGFAAEQGGTASGAWETAAEKAARLAAAMDGVAKGGPGMQGALIQAAAGADYLGVRAEAATVKLQGMLAMAGAAAAGQARAAGAARFTSGIAGRAAGAASGQAVASRLSNQVWGGASASALAGRAASVGGGGSGASAAEKAMREAEKVQREAERAAERAEDIQIKIADAEREYGEKRAAASETRAEKLIDITQNEADKLTDITATAAEKRADIAASEAEKRANLEAQSSAKIKDIRKQEADALKAIDRRLADERESAARGLQGAIAGGGARTDASDAFDNLALAGAEDDPALMAREAAQQARRTGLAAAATRAQGAGDPAVGQAIYAAEAQGLDDRLALDEQYAQRKEELAGDSAALAALDRYYQGAIAKQRVAIEQEIAQATEAQALKAAQAELEKAEVISRAKDERQSVEREKREQTAAIAREAEAQRLKVEEEAIAQRLKVEEESSKQRQKVEEEFGKQSEAITQWADDVERDLQRVIDRSDAAVKALAKVSGVDVRGVGSTGGTAAAAGGAPTGSGKAAGGPVQAGVAYPVGERGPEWFMPYTNGAIIPNGGGSASISLGGIVVNAAPSMDERALADLVAARVNEKLGRETRGRGW